MSVIRPFFPVLVLIAALLGPSAALAQTSPATTSVPTPAPAVGNPHHGRHHHKSLWHALRAVNLTDAQKQQVAAFRDQEQKANRNADEATRRANADTMRSQIMGILTPDQKAQLSTEMHHRSAPNAPANTNQAPSPGSR